MVHIYPVHCKNHETTITCQILLVHVYTFIHVTINVPFAGCPQARENWHTDRYPSVFPNTTSCWYAMNTVMPHVYTCSIYIACMYFIYMYIVAGREARVHMHVQVYISCVHVIIRWLMCVCIYMYDFYIRVIILCTLYMYMYLLCSMLYTVIQSSNTVRAVVFQLIHLFMHECRYGYTLGS